MVELANSWSEANAVPATTQGAPLQRPRDIKMLHHVGAIMLVVPLAILCALVGETPRST